MQDLRLCADETCYFGSLMGMQLLWWSNFWTDWHDRIFSKEQGALEIHIQSIIESVEEIVGLQISSEYL